MQATPVATFPAAHLPRPALDLLASFGPAYREVSLREAVTTARKPSSTVSRWLAALVREGLILHLRRDEYAIPSRPTQALLLAETSKYARSLLLQHNVLASLRHPHAFACLPVRRTIPFALPAAAPVLDLSDARVRNLDEGSFPHAFRATLGSSDKRTETLTFPLSAAQEPDAVARKIPVLDATFALAVYAASADARIVQAALAAAAKLGIDAQDVTRRASGFVVQDAPLRQVYPNTVVLPRWLARFHATAANLHAQHYIAHDARTPDTRAREGE